MAQPESDRTQHVAQEVDVRTNGHVLSRARRLRSAPGGTRRGGQTPPDDLLCALGRQTLARPGHAAFVYLVDAESDDAALTYAELDQRARAVAVHLLGMGLVGERVLLAFPPGLDFITGFFGCLYAGCVAVPTSLPHRRTLDRFRAIAADSGARLVLSTTPAVAQCRVMTGPQIPWLAVNEVPDALAETWRMPLITAETLAMLQYTSGSISRPKGVMISHANLIRNMRDIHRAFALGSETGVFWLPTHHDMGLVGGVLSPVFSGATSVLMAPAAFLQRPISWLAAISRFRGTVTGAPNFAYDLCVRKITDEQRATLDLSCLSLAFIGAEPIQPETLERFADAFAPCGFDAAAFYPCYGLAEATLMVSGAVRGRGPVVRAFDDRALAEDRAEPVPDGAGGARRARRMRRMVSCGSAVGDLRVVIADSRTCAEIAPGHVGEILVSGSSVGQGYWHKPDQTRACFHAGLSDAGESRFLRTGDRGFLLDGELFVIGREDDMLVVRGLNHYPQDLEATARRSHPRLHAGLGAAFAVEDAGGPRLILVQEIAVTGDTAFTAVFESCREAVLAEHGLALHAIVLVRGGTIPRTSSGKVRRRACRELFLARELKTLAEYGGAVIDSAATRTVGTGEGVAPPLSTPPAPIAPQTSVLGTVCQHVLALGSTALSDMTPDTPLTALGLDSLQRVELAAMLENTFACRLPDADFGPSRTLGELARAVQRHLDGHTKVDMVAAPIPPAHYVFTQFPEYRELKRYERMLKAVAGANPYFRVDEGGAPFASVTRLEGRDRVNFCVYDYVGMAHDARVGTAARAAIDRYGTGAGASRLVSGEKQVHRDLERALAGFLGTPAALVFVSGHATNVTTIGHLMGPDDLIVHDVLAHNSIIQGAQLSGATRRVFAHNDCSALAALLSEMRHRYRRVLIAIEGVYSMDGDYPDLPRFVELKKKHKALMLVDEAHSLGTLGPTGRGIGEHWKVARADVDLWMGTLSKSLASCGGYVAGSAELIEYLGYSAPGFVYSVGMCPSNAAAALAALEVLRAEPQRVSRLRRLSELFLTLARERGLDTGSASGTPVVPVIVGNSVKSLFLARALFDRGIYVQPILHPAVPEHSTRLRFFITTNHCEGQIREAVDATADELARLEPRRRSGVR